MIKFKKGFILTLLLSAILVPAVASAGVYFMNKTDGDYVKNPTVRPCESRGFNIIPKKHCGTNQVGSGDLDSSKKCSNPVGVGTSETLHRYCTCNETTYKYETCTGLGNEWRIGQELMGRSCKNELGIEKYSECGCVASKYPYMADSSNCPKDTQADGSKQITKSAVGTPCNNKQNLAGASDFRYPECACSSNYKKTCGYPLVGEGYSCDNRYISCICDRSVYSKSCEVSGSKPQYRCQDDTGVYYSTCNDELPQVKIYVVDGTVDEPQKTSCTDKVQTKGLKDVKVTFSKQGESEVVAYTDGTGMVSIPVPFERDNRPVTIKLEKQLDDKFDGSSQTDIEFITLSDTCNYDGVNSGTYYCDGMLYPLSPKKLGNNEKFIRIITTWGSMSWVGTTMNSYNIRDLDTHMLKNSSAFLYFGNRPLSDDMTLDVDDTQCFGPETMTIPTSSVLAGNTYYFSAIIYSTGTINNDTIKKGMLMVYVYVDGELKRIFKSSQAVQRDTKGTVWNVFRLSKSGNTVKIDGTGGNNHGIIRDIGTTTGSPALNTTSSHGSHGW